MKNALILHGAGNNSQGNWFPWLKEELEKKGYKVWVPDLPNSDIPNQKDWLETIFSNKDWQFNEDSIIVGHSAGATLILRILENLPVGVQINKAVLVAGPVSLGDLEFTFPYKRSLVENPFNWEKIKSSAKNFYLVYSDNDPYQCGVEHGKVINDNIGGELILKTGQGHFNLEVNPPYKEFPLILEILKEK